MNTAPVLDWRAIRGLFRGLAGLDSMPVGVWCGYFRTVKRQKAAQACDLGGFLWVATICLAPGKWSRRAALLLQAHGAHVVLQAGQAGLDGVSSFSQRCN